MDTVDTSVKDRLRELTDRLEKAWQKGGVVDVGRFAPPPEDPLRPMLVQELVKIDMEERWKRGQRTTLEEYLMQFPELGTSAAVSPELLFEEYRVRQRFGDKPLLKTYEERFPNQYAELHRLVSDQPAGEDTQPPTLLSPVSPPPGAAEARVLPVGGGYKLLKRLGSGAFGEVWRAEAPGGVEVAVKILVSSVDQAESHRELEALERMKHLRHAFLVQIHSFYSLEERLLIMMELADGSLRDRQKECRTNGLPGIPLHELLRYMRESADALDYLHERHVQHRDVKPDNILLLGRHVKLADFGLASVMESRRLMTATGCGTPAYMAPEIWRRKVSEHSDQYSLAASYAELRLNRTLYPSRKMVDIMMAHLEKLPDLSPLEPPEQEVLLKALAKDPNKRFGTCLEFTQALEQSIPASEARPPRARKTDPEMKPLLKVPAAREQAPDPHETPTRDPSMPSLRGGVKPAAPAVREPNQRANGTSLFPIESAEPGPLSKLRVSQPEIAEKPRALPAPAEMPTQVPSPPPASEAVPTPAIAASEAVPTPSQIGERTPRPRSLDGITFSWRGEKPKSRSWIYAKIVLLASFVMVALGGALGWYIVSLQNKTEPIPTIVDAGLNHPEPRPPDPVKTNPRQPEETKPVVVIAPEPLDAQAHYERGKELLKGKQYERAVAEFDASLQQNPNFVLAYDARGAANLQLRHYDIAARDFTKVLQQAPKNASAHFHLGKLHSAQGKYREAIDEFNKVERIDANFPELYNARGLAYFNLRQHKVAFNDFSTAIKQHPDSAAAHFDQGFAYFALGKYEEALIDFNDALRIDPTYAEAYNLRGQLFFNQGNYNSALADYNLAIENDDRFARAYNNRGAYYLQQGQLDKAIADLTKALELDPRISNAHYNRGHAYLNKGDYSKAVEDFGEETRLNPQDGSAFSGRGLAYYRQKDYEHAIVDCTKAIDLDKKDAWAFYFRGMAYKETGNFKQAEADLKEARKLDPTLPEFKFDSSNPDKSGK